MRTNQTFRWWVGIAIAGSFGALAMGSQSCANSPEETGGAADDGGQNVPDSGKNDALVGSDSAADSSTSDSSSDANPVQDAMPDAVVEAGRRDAGTPCGRYCVQAETAHCTQQASCEADCESETYTVDPACRTQWTAVLECNAQISTQFECDQTGRAQVKAGFCATENTALLDCEQAH